MSVYQRGKVWHYAFQVDGRRFRGTTKQKTRAKAEHFEALKIAQVQNEGPQAAQQMRRAPVLSDFAPRFLDLCEKQVAAEQIARKSLLYWKNGWRLLKATRVAGMRMDHITASDAAVLLFPGGPSNANCALGTLRRLLSYAVEVKVLRAAPKITLLEARERTALLEPWAEELLLSVAPQPLYDVIVGVQDAGMRPGEVMAIARDDIKWERHGIIVPKAKTSKKGAGRRFVPLSDRFAERLRARIAADVAREKKAGIPPSKWAFPSTGGRSGRASKSGHLTTVQKQWTAARNAANAKAEKAGLPPLPDDLVLYCSRHTFATDLLERTGNIKLVGQVLGHTDLKTTAKYLHPSTADVAEIVNARNTGAKLTLVKSA